MGIKLLLWILLALLFQSVSSHAVAILEVTGPNDFTRVLLSDDAAAAAFTLSTPVNDLSISAELESFGASAVAWLTSGLDVGFQPEDLIAAEAVGSGPLFSGIDLPAGTYFLVIGNNAGALF